MGLGTIIADIGEKCRELLSFLAEIVKSHTKIFIIIISACMAIIILLIIFFTVTSSNSKEGETGNTAIDRRDTILQELTPTESFFLPYEPDFVPDVILEREPRDGWTDEDAKPFWTDPLPGNENFWRKRIESGINTLLENVP